SVRHISKPISYFKIHLLSGISGGQLNLGGPLGLMSIGLMAILVRGLGLLMLGVASTAGQLLGSVLIDVLIPSLGNSVYLVTIIGTLFALVGAIVTTIPEYRTSKTMKKMEV
ncbi:hypothetical protein PO452_21880, partial [Escherichia coli]